MNSAETLGQPAMDTRKLATSLFKALDVLTLLSSRGRRMNIQQIVDAMGLPRSSVLRLLDSLIHYGLVDRNADREYYVTGKFKHWRMDDWNEQQIARFRPLMQRLCLELGELVVLGRLEGRHIRYLSCEEPHRRVRVTPPMEKRYNLEVTAMGKLVMSQRPDLVPAGCSEKLKKEIEEAGRLHYAWNIRESEPDIITWATWAGEASVLTPFLVVAWPDTRFSEQSLTKAKAILRRASTEMGSFALFHGDD